MMTNFNTSRIKRAFSHWLLELSKILTRRRSDPNRWQTLLRRTAEGMDIYTKAAGALKHVGTVPDDTPKDQLSGLRNMLEGQASSHQVLLRLAPNDIIERTIRIPAAARDVVGPIVENQMDRIVPWRRDNTSYGYRVAGISADAPDQLDVAIVATTKRTLDSAVERAERLGLKPYAVDFVSPNGEATAMQLAQLGSDPVKETAKFLQTGLTAIAAICVVTFGIGIYYLINLQGEDDDLQARLAIANSKVEEVKRLNERNGQLREQRERLLKRKLDEPAKMVLIEALSRSLPDSAYLTELEIHGSDTHISGKSADPTALIPRLEGSAHFEDVHFSAPTTREEGETIGTFSIVGRGRGGSYLESKP